MFKPTQPPTTQTPVSFCSRPFDQYVITLPEDAAPLLKDRVFAVIMHRLYDVHTPHDMSLDLLNNLHDLLMADIGLDDMHEQEHLLQLNELQLSVLKRFIVWERQMAIKHRPRMNWAMSNYGYWLLLGELLENCERRACKLRNLSFFA